MAHPLLNSLRSARLAFGALAIATAVGSLPASGAEPYELNAILPVTGGAAFLGTSEVHTMQMVETLTNRAGGIKGRPLKINILDDQTNPQVAAQLVTQLMAKNVPVFLGPGISATCSAIAPLVSKSGPASYCFSPAIHPPAGSFQFSASVDTVDLGPILVRFFKGKGWTRIALMTSTDTTGQDFDRVMERTLSLPEFRRQPRGARTLQYRRHQHRRASRTDPSSEAAGDDRLDDRDAACDRAARDPRRRPRDSRRDLDQQHVLYPAPTARELHTEGVVLSRDAGDDA